MTEREQQRKARELERHLLEAHGVEGYRPEDTERVHRQLHVDDEESERG